MCAMPILATLKDKTKAHFKNTQSDWWLLSLIVFISAQLYVLMEWIFHVTKYSFLNMLSIQDKVRALFFTGVMAAGLSLLVLCILYGVGGLLGLRRRPGLLYTLLTLVPACILGATLFLLVDNFTYTLFSFGVATSKGIWRGLYALFFLALIAWSEWKLVGWIARIRAKSSAKKILRTATIGMGIWLTAGFGLMFLLTSSEIVRKGEQAVSDQDLSSSPHILWITGDGISAEHLSLYGYERETTPYLDEIAKSSLVAENSFSNSKHTAGSLVSMFTGKDPLQTRVLYPPDILRGKDAYQHLPGILRAHGYYSIQYGYIYYVDAYTTNMLDAFDNANGRFLSGGPIQEWLREHLSGEMAYFVYEIGNRIADRIRHVFYIKTMQNPYELVVGDAPLTDDDQRIESLLTSLEEFQQPTFIHLHLMGTHGPRFQLKEQIFSFGRDPAGQGEWEADFYDDAILEFDANVGRIVEALKQHGLLENTLLIIGSDHAVGSDQRQRIPLLMRFPGGEVTGRIEANVQGLDIAPTILDYLGLPQPDWMSGLSLLGGNVAQRYIYGVGAGHIERSEAGRWHITPEQNKPPFYQIGRVSIIDCQRWYELNLLQLSFNSGDIVRHSAPCTADQILTPQAAYDLLLQYLREHEFDVGSIEDIPIESLMKGE